jgi:hypothetical protein
MTMEKIFAPEEPREVVRGWLIHARKAWKKQDEAARRMEAQYRRVGVASVVLSAIVGASIFAALESAFEPWSRIAAGIVSICAAVLSGLLTFHRYEERAEKHRAAAVSYKAALRALERAHTPPGAPAPERERLDRIEAQLDELEKSAPVVPQEVDRAAEESYQAYDFVARAADLRRGDG